MNWLQIENKDENGNTLLLQFFNPGDILFIQSADYFQSPNSLLFNNKFY